MTLSKPTRRTAGHPLRQTVRLIELRGEVRLQWALDFRQQQTHENLTIDESIERAASLLGNTYRNAHLFTAEADYEAHVGKSGACRLSSSLPSRKAHEHSASHDRTKPYLIPEGTPCPFLVALGVMTAQGRVRKSRYDKFRQINRYLEFVDDVYGHLPPEGRLEVVDFGCGLSYLTFALHHLLTAIRGREVRIRGIDRKDSVITRCRQITGDVGLRGLEFSCGDIRSLHLDRPVHLAVSLHACDTATDDALAAAVQMNADVILAAPCCQHELFTGLDSEPLVLVTRHGILKERFAALATDALRAAVLQQHGYRTQVIEFIDTEHTPKNLLLRAVRRPGGEGSDDCREIEVLKQLLGIGSTRLEQLLDAATD